MYACVHRPALFFAPVMACLTHHAVMSGHVGGHDTSEVVTKETLSTACPRPHPRPLDRMPSALSTACPPPRPLDRMPSPSPTPSRLHALDLTLSLSTACLHPLPLDRVHSPSPTPSRLHAFTLSLSTACTRPLDRMPSFFCPRPLAIYSP